MSIVKDFISSIRKAVSPEKDPVQEICNAADVIYASSHYHYDEYEGQTPQQVKRDEEAVKAINTYLEEAFSIDPEETLTAVCSLKKGYWAVEGLNDKIETLLDRLEETDPELALKQRKGWLWNAETDYYEYFKYGNLGIECGERQEAAIKRLESSPERHIVQGTAPTEACAL